MKHTNLSKCDLAMMYAPTLSPHAAVARLMMWLKKDSDTMSRLYATGYTDHQKVFSPRQVRIIIDFLGEP